MTETLGVSWDTKFSGTLKIMLDKRRFKSTLFDRELHDFFASILACLEDISVLQAIIWAKKFYRIKRFSSEGKILEVEEIKT